MDVAPPAPRITDSTDLLDGMVELNKNVYALCDYFDGAARGDGAVT